MKKLTVIIAAMILSLSAVSFAAESSFTVKSGLCFSEQWGLYIANIVEKDGKISNVIIDRLANGKSSKELHNNYGIKPVSTLGKDWWEQVAYYERWVVDNGLDAVETDDKGHALNPDLISGATINVAELSVRKTEPHFLTMRQSSKLCILRSRKRRRSGRCRFKIGDRHYISLPFFLGLTELPYEKKSITQNY